MATKSTQSNSKPDLHIPFFERVKSIPEVLGVRVNEEPKYDVLKKYGRVEVRRYQKQLRAKVTLDYKNFDQFREVAFKKLAAYIFGGNENKSEIAMTSPVLEANIDMTSPVLEESHADGGWTMSFILPQKYTMQNVPKPRDSAIKLEEVEAYTAVAIRYTGNNTKEAIDQFQHRLEKWLGEHPEVIKSGNFFAAQYDAPFTISFLKRNEIMARVMLSH